MPSGIPANRINRRVSFGFIRARSSGGKVLNNGVSSARSISGGNRGLGVVVVAGSIVSYGWSGSSGI